MQRKFILIALLAAQLAAAQSTVITRSTALTRTTKLGLSLAFTFSLVQEHNCTITSGVNSCTFSVSPNLASGNLDVFSCVAQDSGATQPPAISSISNAGGTLVQAVGASVGLQGTPPPANNRLFTSYILPSTSTGGAGNPVITFTLTPDFGGYCYMAELHPSANGSNVGLDIDGMFQPAAACTSCTGNNWTDSGTNDACLVGQTGTSAFNLYPTAVTTPYNTHAFFSSSALAAGFSEAITSSGTAPTWTEPSGTPVLSTVCFGWNPTAPIEMSLNTFAGVGNGSSPTVAQLAAAEKGWQGGTWSITGSDKGDTTHYQGFLHAQTRTAGDGTVYGPGGTSVGIVNTGTGTSTANYIQYTWATSNITSMTAVVPFCTDITTGDLSDVDLFQIGSSGGNYVNIQGIPSGGVWTFGLETETAAGSSPITYPTGNSCANGGNGWVWLMIQFNTTGNSCAGGPCDYLAVYNSSGAQIGSTNSAAETGTNWPAKLIIGNLGAQTLTNGVHFYYGTPYFVFTLSGVATFPLTQ